MNLLLPMLILSLEMLLTYQFTQSLYPAVLVLIFLYTPFSFRINKRILNWLFILTALAAAAICINRSLDLLDAPVIIQIIVQVLQAVCFIYVITPVHGATKLEIQLKSAANMQLFTLGFVSVYIAYSHHSAPISPFISSGIGVGLLILLALQIENCVPAKISMALRGHYSRFSWVRLGIIILMIGTTLTLAGITAPHLQNGGDGIRDWMNSLSFGKTKQSSSHSSNGNQPRPSGSGMPGRYMTDTRIQLQHNYQLNVPHIPDLHLIMDDNNRAQSVNRRIYIKCLTFDSFENMEWFNSESKSRLIYDSDDGRNDGLIVFNQYVRNPVTYTICMLTARSRLMPSIPTVAVIEQRVIEQKEHGIMASPINLSNVTHFAYSMTSSDVKWNDLSPGQRAADMAEPIFTRLEDSALSEKIRELTMKIVGSSRSTSARVEKIIDYLGRHYEYSLKTRNRDHLHPLDNFLFHEKRGHCELFATSFVLMLRSIGISARLSVGYSGGEYDDRYKLYTFFKDDSHAWSEIYLKEFGWVTIDPTPAASGLVPASPAIKRRSWGFRKSDFPLLSDLVNIKFPETGENQGKAVKWYQKLPAFMSPTFMVNLSLIVLAFFYVLVLRVAREKKSDSKRTFSRKHSPDFFRSFCRHFAGQGCPIKRGDTPLEYLSELKKRGLVAGECDELINYFSESTYGKLKRSSSQENRFKSILRKLPGRSDKS